MARAVAKVGVVGLGAMGAGIAQLCIEAGLETVGREIELERAEAARDRIAHFLTRKIEKGQLAQEARDEAVARLRLTTDLTNLGECDLVIEAAFEDLAVKHELFRALESVVATDAILATNTSALSVTEIASVTERPERVVGMHFFNPAPLMPLVEIVRAERTADDVFDAAYAFGARLGKEPIACSDTPGFVVNRVLIPLLNDCVRVLDEAGLTPEDLDAGMRHGAGWPMGPCALLDLVGVDVHVHASEALYEKTREPRMAPHRASCAWRSPASSAARAARASTRTSDVRWAAYARAAWRCATCAVAASSPASASGSGAASGATRRCASCASRPRATRGGCGSRTRSSVSVRMG